MAVKCRLLVVLQVEAGGVNGTDCDIQPRTVEFLDLGGNNDKTQMGLAHLLETD